MQDSGPNNNQPSQNNSQPQSPQQNQVNNASNAPVPAQPVTTQPINTPNPVQNAGQAPVSPQPAGNTNTTVLLVEDDPLLIKMYKAKFANEGINLLVAEDGEAGLSVATSHRPNFIVLDVMMPKMSGLDLLEKLMQNQDTKNIGVIVLSNLSQEKESKRALELGAKEYILKASLTPKELIDKIKGYLSAQR